ncbi:MAG: hypothetical protein ACRDJU_05565 [Actinomycetota bacterium]
MREPMLALFLLIVIIAIAIGLVGLLVKGLIWLLIIGIILFLLNLVVAGFRAGSRRASRPQR